MKIFWLFNHPAPYKVDFFNVLGQRADLEVYFERASEKGRNAIFYSEKPLNFSAHLCKGISWGSLDNYTHTPIKVLKKEKFDIIVLNGWRTLTEQRTIAFCKRKKIPYVFLINGGIIKEKESRLAKAYKTHFISGASAYLAPDEVSSRYLVYYGADKSKIRLYPYSSVFDKEVLEKPLSREEKAKRRNELNLKGTRVFLSAGQLIARKNYEALIRLWVSRPIGDCLYILGEGPLKEALQKVINECGLKNVFLLPYKPHAETLRYFSAADAFLFPSKEDIYGHVINEALSQGIPVISSPKVNATTHLIQEGKNGHIISFQNEEELNRALSSIPSKDMESNALAVGKENTLEKSAGFFLNYFSGERL